MQHGCDLSFCHMLICYVTNMLTDTGNVPCNSQLNKHVLLLLSNMRAVNTVMMLIVINLCYL